MKRDLLFFPRLAMTNLRKNGATYIPYLLTCIGSFVIVYTNLAITRNPGMDSMPGATSLRSMLAFGSVIISLFSAVFILYTNSFLIKRRQKELALYGILGLEKRHVARTLFYETAYVFVLTAGAGLFLGNLLGKLMFLLLLKIVKIPTTLEFSPGPAISLMTLAIFAAIFTLILAANLLRIRSADPIRLMQRERQGEREPRSSWLLTGIGLLALGAAYAFALTVESPVTVLGTFFLAVLLVIVGTFALFTSGSIAVLKLLKRNRRFYYRPDNFISVSGMMYRMKQNAAGLASICILSTMVLITLSTTVALYIGQEDILRDRYPLDATVIWEEGGMSREEMAAFIREQAGRHSVVVADQVAFLQQVVHAVRSGASFHDANDGSVDMLKDQSDHFALHLMLLEDVNRIEGTARTLEPGEILVHSKGPDYRESTMTFGSDGSPFTVKEELSSFRLHSKNKDLMEVVVTVVFRDRTDLDRAAGRLLQGASAEIGLDSQPRENIMVDLSGRDEDILAFSQELGPTLGTVSENAELDSRQLMETDWFCTYGGFLFIGIFIGGMFLMATVLIIYYKQVSEGHQDRVRFEIMQKVGMDHREVNRTIRKQILLVFFLPLAGAVTHVAFAFGILPKMLALFGLHDTPLFLLCTGVTILVFTLLYLAVYTRTARTYNRIVRLDSASV